MAMEKQPTTTDAICGTCGGHVAMFNIKPPTGPITPKCARCRMKGRKVRTEHALRLRVERALTRRPA